MNSARTLAFVLAGGEGSRLRPFTATVPKPALPFGGHNRIIDFVLSNLYNSGVDDVCVLLQYRPQVLLDHLLDVWAFRFAARGGRLLARLPSSLAGGAPFLGTADAVRRTLDLAPDRRPDLVGVFAADHVYRMDVRQMIAFHRREAAAVTVSALPVEREHAREFGILATDAKQRVIRFEEKPQDPAAMTDRPRFSLASMGNYLFDPLVLRRALDAAAARSEHDFGRHVLPALVTQRAVHAYDFHENRIPGAGSGPNYWRDVGGVEAYIAAHRETLGAHPVFALDNPDWPIFPTVTPASAMQEQRHENLFGPGVVAEGARVRRSVLQRGARVEPGSEVDNCILMEGVKVGRGARLRNAIVASGSVISRSTHIGFDSTSDRSRFLVMRSGTVVVSPGALVAQAAPGRRHEAVA